MAVEFRITGTYADNPSKLTGDEQKAITKRDTDTRYQANKW